MVTLGPCVGSLSAALVEYGTAEGTWADNVLTVVLPAGPTGETERVVATITANGAGTLSVEVAGDGYECSTDPEILISSGGTGLLSMRGPGGSTTPCGLAALVVDTGTNPVEVAVACGTIIEVIVTQNPDAEGPGTTITITFTPA